MNNIIEKQNEYQYLQLLAAQRKSYTKSKNLQIFDLLSVFIAIVLPVITVSKPDLINWMTVTSVVWTICYLIASIFRSKSTKTAALIQEEFDTNLFNINWNEVLCGDRVLKDKIISLAENENIDTYKNWYSQEIDTSLPEEIAVLLCQRENSCWELGLRKKYMDFLLWVGGVYYGLFFIVMLVKDIGLIEIIILLSCSISFLIFIVTNTISQVKHLESKESVVRIIDGELSRYAESKQLPTKITIRSVQDVIFGERNTLEKVPDWFHERFRNKNEKRAEEIIHSIKSTF